MNTYYIIDYLYDLVSYIHIRIICHLVIYISLAQSFKNKNLEKLTCADVIVAYAISKHLKGRSVPRVSHVFGSTKDFVIFMFLDTFRIQGILLFSLLQDTFRMAQQRILSFSCFQTLSVFKGFCCFPVSGHFPYSRDFAVFLFPDTFRIQGILSFSRFQTLSVISDPRVIRCPLFVLWLHKRCCLYLCLK